DHYVRLWDANTGRVLRTMHGRTGPVFSVTFSPEGTRILAGGARGGVTVWDSQTGRQMPPLLLAAAPISYSPDGKHIVTGCPPASARLDSTTAIEMLIVKANAGPVSAWAFSPDGKHILTNSRDNTATLWGRANPGLTTILS